MMNLTYPIFGIQILPFEAWMSLARTKLAKTHVFYELVLRIMKAIIGGYENLLNNGGTAIDVMVSFMTSSTVNAVTNLVVNLSGQTQDQLALDTENEILNYATLNSFSLTRDDIEGVLIKKTGVFSGTVSGGSGNAVIYLDTNGDGSGNAIYPTLTTSKISITFDGVSEPHSPATVTLDGSKKFVTVNVKKYSFSTGNVLLNLLGTLTQALTGVTQVNASNGVSVKVIIG